jgi:hypothetical protein
MTPPEVRQRRDVLAVYWRRANAKQRLGVLEVEDSLDLAMIQAEWTELQGLCPHQTRAPISPVHAPPNTPAGVWCKDCNRLLYSAWPRFGVPSATHGDGYRVFMLSLDRDCVCPYGARAPAVHFSAGNCVVCWFYDHY